MENTESTNAMGLLMAQVPEEWKSPRRGRGNGVSKLLTDEERETLNSFGTWLKDTENKSVNTVASYRSYLGRALYLARTDEFFDINKDLSKDAKSAVAAFARWNMSETEDLEDEVDELEALELELEALEDEDIEV